MDKEFKTSHFDNIEELLKHCDMWIKDEDYDAYCRWFDMGAMEELVNHITNLKQALNEIREYCNNQKKAINPKNMNVGKLNLEIDDSTMAIYNTVNDILQIIDKYMKEDD